MKNIENFLLLCGFQTLVLSCLLLLAVVLVRGVFRKRTTALVSSGLFCMVLLWGIALVPMTGWLVAYLESNETQVHSDRPVELVVGKSDAGVSIDDELGVDSNNLKQVDRSNEQNSLASFIKIAMLQMGQLDAPDDGSVAASPASKSWAWKSWFASLVSLAIAIGFLRLLLAHWTLWRLHSNSQVVDESDLLELLEVLRARSGCSRGVAIRETVATGAAFTVGFFQPTIFLAKSWRQWKQDELEATLAHEIAHIQSGDFLQRVLAQLAAALNFYNPIVHYLCNQLCIDQEFSADERASDVIGGRKKYLNSLALMALDNDISNQRLAPMFLPTRKTFFRRIEMLRSKQTSGIEGGYSRWFGYLLSIALVFIVAGIRFPNAQANANPSVVELVAVEKEPVTQEPTNLRYVPEELGVVLVFRPKELLQNENIKKMNAALAIEQGKESEVDTFFNDMFGVKVEDVEQLTMFVQDLEADWNSIGMVVQMAKPDWWAGDVNEAQAKAQIEAVAKSEFRGRRIYQSQNTTWQAMYCMPDERTMIVTSPSSDEGASLLRMKSCIRSENGPQGVAWFDDWQQHAGSSFSCSAAGRLMDVVAEEITSQNNFAASLAKPILEHARYVVGGVEIDDSKLDAEIVIGTDGGSDKSVKLISDSATALVAGGRAILDAARSSSAVGDEAEADAMSVFVDLASDVLSNVEIKKESKSVRLSTELKSDDGKLLSPFIPAFQAIGQARYKAEVLNRSRNIALALLNYESAYGKFPAAVMTSKHGKKYSWRVAVLPYIGRQDLFEKYRFDQAWDSEENMKLAKDIPIEFQHPMARGQEKQFTPFFVITGAGTAFDGQQSIEIDKIIDGTSNTISVVEAKKEVFWSQPVDIKYENGKLNTKLGRFSSGTFVTSFFDGSTRLVSDKIDSKILSYMILPSDGNVSNVDVQTGR